MLQKGAKREIGQIGCYHPRFILPSSQGGFHAGQLSQGSCAPGRRQRPHTSFGAFYNYCNSAKRAAVWPIGVQSVTVRLQSVVCNILLYIMAIDILPGAQTDLRGLRKSDPDAFAAVLAFLVEAAADDGLISKCTTNGDIEIGSTSTNVKRWVEASNKIGNIFRFRFFDVPAIYKYRIVYGFDWHTGRFGILAVVHRDNFNYEIRGTLANRIREDWFGATDGRYT